MFSFCSSVNRLTQFKPLDRWLILISPQNVAQKPLVFTFAHLLEQIPRCSVLWFEAGSNREKQWLVGVI